MASSQTIVTVTEDVTGNTYNVGADTIAYVVDRTTVREFTWIDPIVKERRINVTEALAAIITDAANMISVTATDGGATIGLNANRISSIQPSTAGGSLLEYSDEIRQINQIETDEDTATIIAAVDAL